MNRRHFCKAGLSALATGNFAAGFLAFAESPKPPDLGIGANLNGKLVFPADNPWNDDISKLPVDKNSEALIASIGVRASLHPDFGPDSNSGIPFVVVSGKQKSVEVKFDAPDESDPGPYPIPSDAPIE